MEKEILKLLRVDEWPKKFSIPAVAVLAGGVLIKIGVAGKRKSIQERDTRKDGQLDSNELYRLWCGGDRSVEDLLIRRLEIDVKNAIERNDIVTLSVLVSQAKHLPSISPESLRYYEQELKKWKYERYSAIFSLFKFVRPRVEMITVIAVLGAIRPFCWERVRLIEERLTDSAKEADIRTFMSEAMKYVVISLADSAVAWMISTLQKQQAEIFTQAATSKILTHLLTIDLSYFETHKTNLLTFHDDMNKLEFLVTDRLFQILKIGISTIHATRHATSSKGQLLVSVGCMACTPVLVFLRSALNAIEVYINGYWCDETLIRKYQEKKEVNSASGLVSRISEVRCAVAEDFEVERVIHEEMTTFNDNRNSQSVGERMLESVRGTVIPNAVLLYLCALSMKAIRMDLLPPSAVVTTAECSIEAFEQWVSLYEEVSELPESDYAIRLISLLNSKPTIDVGTGIVLTPQNIESQLRFPVTVNNMSFGYHSGDVLHDISLSIGVGSVAVIGKSGCGKSTLASLLSRMYDPSSGNIAFGGIDIRKFEVRSYRRKVALVQQDVKLPPAATVMAALSYGIRSCEEEEVIRISKLMDLHKSIISLPNGYDTRLGPGGVMLSGGQSQRIAIARALLSKPQLLILDEATSGLDGETELLVIRNIQKEMKGRSLVMIAHRATTASYCDEVICLKDGRVAEMGSISDLISKDGETAKLLAIQKWG
eukprot:TRINITY_DN6554_c0_g1_i1.p1 TRINITY_DN6554_c0_g1~~TRINITY_DN6554_c0_g1_i1.p1  ORF type:complete len:711 (+),score=121.18 TRINITY_DN6554_c0_g1_i1:124-2256(+)